MTFILIGYCICMEIYFVGTKCSGGNDELASRFHQHNESPQNLSPYKSSNFFIVHFCIYFLIFRTVSATISKNKSMIMLSTFYFLHRVSNKWSAVICHRPCLVTYLVSKINKHGRQTFVTDEFSPDFWNFKECAINLKVSRMSCFN